MRPIRENFHTHSTFCDGHDTPEAMLARARELGFRALGFSGHSYVDFDPCGMTPDSEANYYLAIRALHDPEIEILCGIEQDYYSGRAGSEYDYAIGSVHYIQKPGYTRENCLFVDWSAARIAEIIEKVYGGDAIAMAEDYYALVGALIDVTGCQIIGHFDLLTKFDESGAVFDPTDPRYIRAWQGALDALCAGGRRPVFEINTGAMARGYRRTPFPHLSILQALYRRHCPIMINSDCHDRRYLDFGFDTAAAIAQEAGYTERVVFQHGQLTSVNLN